MRRKCFGKRSRFTLHSVICKECNDYSNCKRKVCENLKIPKSSIVQYQRKTKR